MLMVNRTLKTELGHSGVQGRLISTLSLSRGKLVCSHPPPSPPKRKTTIPVQRAALLFQGRPCLYPLSESVHYQGTPTCNLGRQDYPTGCCSTSQHLNTVSVFCVSLWCFTLPCICTVFEMSHNIVYHGHCKLILLRTESIQTPIGRI